MPDHAVADCHSAILGEERGKNTYGFIKISRPFGSGYFSEACIERLPAAESLQRHRGDADAGSRDIRAVEANLEAVVFAAVEHQLLVGRIEECLVAQRDFEEYLAGGERLRNDDELHRFDCLAGDLRAVASRC